MPSRTASQATSEPVEAPALTAGAVDGRVIHLRPGRRARRQAFYFYLFVSPWLLGFLALTAFPIVLGFLMSFTNYDGFSLDRLEWVGTQNYSRAWEDPDARYAFGRTLAFLVVAVPATVLLQLGLALLLNRAVRGRGLFRTLFYLPTIIPVVASVWMWKVASSPEGLLNGVINLVTGHDPGIHWLVDHPTGVLRLFVIWAWSGTGMLIFLAALQGIPTELREAAAIDGASGLQVARKIVLPLLTPVIFFQLIWTLYLAFQILQEPILLNPGLAGLANPPPHENNLFVVTAFQEAFVGQRFGYSAALLWILFATALLAVLALFATSRYWVYYERAPKKGRR
jgi:multiple sugar transport system permease protein